MSASPSTEGALSQTMPSSSQSGPPQGPPSSPPRRLQSPEERFGTHPLYAVDALPAPDAPPDPFAPLPDETPSVANAPRSKNRPSKARHERQRFERASYRVPPRHSTRSRSRVAGKSTAHSTSPSQTAPLSSAPVVSPTLNRIRDDRRRFRKRLGAFMLALLVVAAGAGALFAPQMNIESVQISGLHATSPVLVQPIARRLLGHNALRANKNAVVQSVERLPTVASARVVLGAALPPRVELRVVERVPVMRLGDGTSWWVADESGNPYRKANARDAKLPALTWSGPVQTLKPLDPQKWDDALQLVQAVKGQSTTKQSGELGPIHSMQLDASGDATLKLAASDGGTDMTLKLGNDEWEQKLQRARTAMMYFARTKRQAAELNLIALELPRWTPRGATTSQATPAPAETQTPAT